ncbi:hypothetical protein C2W62_30525 [Candidatus Entotheonella serta]|nr:hypothetical protein C2W62_30525 [Candidatus Entotheonella serta]
MWTSSVPRLTRLSGMRSPMETCVEQSKPYFGMRAYEVRSWRRWIGQTCRLTLPYQTGISDMDDLKQQSEAFCQTPRPQEHRRLLPADGQPIASLQAYEAVGGLTALRQSQQAQPERIIDELTRSGLRGRGGGGFSTGAKWAGIRREGTGTRYVCCNGAEGEPGTFKDRYLLRMNPYQVLEGVAIAAYTVGAPRAFICLKQSFNSEFDRLQEALDELMASGILGTPPSPEISLVFGPEEYLFGEEKALLEVSELMLPLAL